MKHTDFYSLYQEIQKREYAELAEAVKAHGGSFSFIDELDEDDLPVVMASRYEDDGYSDYIVTEVKLGSKYINIFGYKKYGYEEDTDVLEFVANGHLEYIIDAIPETEEVQDVTLKQ